MSLKVKTRYLSNFAKKKKWRESARKCETVWENVVYCPDIVHRVDFMNCWDAKLGYCNKTDGSCLWNANGRSHGKRVAVMTGIVHWNCAWQKRCLTSSWGRYRKVLQTFYYLRWARKKVSNTTLSWHFYDRPTDAISSSLKVVFSLTYACILSDSLCLFHVCVGMGREFAFRIGHTHTCATTPCNQTVDASTHKLNLTFPLRSRAFPSCMYSKTRFYKKRYSQVHTLFTLPAISTHYKACLSHKLT